MSERGWVTVENAIEICRSPEDVFDYPTGITTEVEWNPRTRRVEKLTPGPIGLGTRFGAEWIKGNPAIARVRPVRAAGGLGGHRSFPAPGCEGRGADLAGGTGLPSHGQNQTPAQGVARPALAVDAANDARARRSEPGEGQGDLGGHEVTIAVPARAVLAWGVEGTGGRSGDVSRGHAPGLGAHQLVSRAAARDALRDHRIRRPGRGRAASGIPRRPGMPRQHRRRLVGGPPGVRVPGHRTVALRLLRLDAAEGCHARRSGGRLRAAARPSRRRSCRRDRVLGRERVGPGVRAAPSRARNRADPGLLPAGRRNHDPQGFRTAVPPRLQRRPPLLDLPEGHAGRILTDDGKAEGVPALATGEGGDR